MGGEGWRCLPLGEFVTLQRGHDLPESERRLGTVPVMGSFGITGYHDTAKASGPGVTVGRSGASFGVVNFCPADYWPHNTALYVVDFHGNDERFAYYFLKSLDFSRYNSGSAQASLNRNYIHPIPVEVPPLPEQKRIAHILGTLDDKIEMNRRMCQTLEEMARALFKSWFVDFDPVRAKAEGRQPAGMDAATAALFPDSFVDSELGPIPEGWEVKRLGDVAENVRRPVSAGAAEPETPYVGLEHMPRRSLCLWVTGRAGDVTSQKSAFRRGEILFGKLRPYFHKVAVAVEDGVCSTDILVVAPRMPELLGFVLGHVNGDEFVSFADAASTGTRMPRTSWPAMARYAVALPPETVVTAWNGYAQRFVAQLRANITESQTLAAARDVLLPRLLNDEQPQHLRSHDHGMG